MRLTPAGHAVIQGAYTAIVTSTPRICKFLACTTVLQHGTHPGLDAKFVKSFMRPKSNDVALALGIYGDFVPDV